MHEEEAQRAKAEERTEVAYAKLEGVSLRHLQLAVDVCIAYLAHVTRERCDNVRSLRSRSMSRQSGSMMHCLSCFQTSSVKSSTNRVVFRHA